MDMRIALLYGCYLVSSGGAVQLQCQQNAYDADDPIPVDAVPELSATVTAREFVRQSMLTLMGEDENHWPGLARRFAGAPPAA